MTFDRDLKQSVSPSGDDGPTLPEPRAAARRLPIMSEKDLAALGAPDLVYIRSTGEAGNATRLHGADGSLLAEFTTLEAALGAVQLNELSLVQLH